MGVLTHTYKPLFLHPPPTHPLSSFHMGLGRILCQKPTSQSAAYLPHPSPKRTHLWGVHRDPFLCTAVHILRHTHTPKLYVRAFQVRHRYPSLAFLSCHLRLLYLLSWVSYLDVRRLGLRLSSALVCDLLPRRLKLGFKRAKWVSRSPHWRALLGRTLWAYGTSPTLVGGHHYDRAQHFLKVRETSLLGLVSPRIHANPQAF